MPVYYDDTEGEFAIAADNCPDCGGPRYDSGCEAPSCNGISFPCCGTGCDLDFDPNGRCAKAAAQESEEERDERHNRERAAFGLPPL